MRNGQAGDDDVMKVSQENYLKHYRQGKEIMV